MQVDRKHFKEEGYNILRNVVPPEQLQQMRDGIEHMVNRRKEVSAQKRMPNEPPGGAWEASGQPRLQFYADCDAESAFTIEFFLHENTLVLCQSLIDGYSRLSLIRASSVVNCHLTVARCAFLLFCHA